MAWTAVKPNLSEKERHRGYKRHVCVSKRLVPPALGLSFSFMHRRIAKRNRARKKISAVANRHRYGALVQIEYDGDEYTLTEIR